MSGVVSAHPRARAGRPAVVACTWRRPRAHMFASSGLMRTRGPDGRTRTRCYRNICLGNYDFHPLKQQK